MRHAMTTTEKSLTTDVVNGIEFKVADLSLAELAARNSTWPSTRCPV